MKARCLKSTSPDWLPLLMNSRSIRFSWILLALSIAIVWSFHPALQARVLDNFDDNKKTDWTDFTFVPGFGLPKEANGQFQFELPSVSQGIFSASQKTSETFELREGRTIEFRVDVTQAGARAVSRNAIWSTRI